MVKKSLLARFFRRGGDAGTIDVRESRGGNRVAAKDRGVASEPRVRVEPAPAPPAARKPIAREEQVVEVKEARPTPIANGSSADRAESPAPAPAPAKSEAPAVKAEPPAAPKTVAVDATAVRREEELRSTIQQGLQGINSVLDGIDRKIDRQQKTSEELVVSVRQIPDIIKDSPDASKAGLELLARISTVLENQGRATADLLAKMNDLPSTVEQLQAHLSEQVSELAKSNRNVDKTMHDTQRQLSNAFHEVRKTVDQATSESERKQQQMVTELRSQQAKQDQRVADLLARQASATKMVVFLLVLSIVALLLVVRQLSG